MEYSRISPRDEIVTHMSYCFNDGFTGAGTGRSSVKEQHVRQ
jgi:hypothetical protein